MISLKILFIRENVYILNIGMFIQYHFNINLYFKVSNLRQSNTSCLDNGFEVYRCKVFANLLLRCV